MGGDVTDTRDIIEKEALSTLVDEVGESTALRLFGIFRKECTTFTEALDAELRQRNIEQVCIIAHSLKGSARQFGANKLSDLCRTLEALSESASSGSSAPKDNEMSAALAELKSESARVQSRLTEILTEKPAHPPT